MRHIRRITAALLTTALTACSEDPASPALSLFDVAIDVSQSQYSLDGGASATVTITNNSRHNIYLARSEYVHIERLQNGQWIGTRSWESPDAVVVPTFSVAPRASRITTVAIPDDGVSQPGTYRFRYQAFTDWKGTIPLPIDERVSASFQVVQ